MELILQILMLFIFINCVLKLSFWKWWQAGIFGFLCAAFMIAVYPYSILQSKTQINDYLVNKNVLQDMAVLITVESAICFAFCFAFLCNLFGKATKRWIYLLYWYPSLLLFPVLFYLLTQLIFHFPGIDFSVIAYSFASVVLLVIPLVSYGIKLLLPEEEWRLEVHFLSSLFVCILGLLTTVNGDVTYAAVDEPADLKAIVFSIGLFAVAFLFGWGWSKLKWRIPRNKNKNDKKSR